MHWALRMLMYRLAMFAVLVDVSKRALSTCRVVRSLGYSPARLRCLQSDFAPKSTVPRPYLMPAASLPRSCIPLAVFRTYLRPTSRFRARTSRLEYRTPNSRLPRAYLVPA